VGEIERASQIGRPFSSGRSPSRGRAFEFSPEEAGIPHNLLNASIHEREGEIIAQAGRAGAVTISTNMAGRGTDILLGGNPKFLAKAMVGEDLDPEGKEKAFQEALAKTVPMVQKEKEKSSNSAGSMSWERRGTRPDGSTIS